MLIACCCYGFCSGISSSVCSASFSREDYHEQRDIRCVFCGRAPMNKFTRSGVFCAMCSLSAAALGAPVALSNQGFESGLTDWTSNGAVLAVGTTTVTTYAPFPSGSTWTVYPFQTHMAELTSNNGVDFSSNIADLDAFFGLPPGTINSYIPEAYNGSGIKQSFTGSAGDVLKQYYNFFSTEDSNYDYGDGTHPDDTAFAVITSSGLASFTFLASTQSVGLSGHTNWQTFNYTLPATDTYTIGFGVVNWRDEYYDAILFVDDGTPSVPEPGSLALLGLGLSGLCWLRRRKSLIGR